MADNQKFVQAQPFQLAGAGAIIGATSIILKTFKDTLGNNLLMTDFGSKGWITLEPGNGDREEQVSFTGVTQNANGTATLTGVKNVLNKSPYTETSGLLISHPGGVNLVISNTAGFYDNLLSKSNDETISGLFTFSTLPQSSVVPVSPLDIVTKDYVDSRNGYWEAPVATIIDLPTGQQIGETRVVLTPLSVYVWTGAAWTIFGAAPVTSNPTRLLGSQSTGSDLKTFVSDINFNNSNNVMVYLSGALVAEGVSADYVTSGNNTVIFNYTVNANDLITLFVIQ